MRDHEGGYDLIALDVANGGEIRRLADDVTGSLKVYLAAAGDNNPWWLATMLRDGLERPFLWDARTGERHELRLDSVDGDVIPMDWSADGAHIILRQSVDVRQRLYMYEVDADSARAIMHPGGTIGTTEVRSIFFGLGGDLFARWEGASHPPCTLRLAMEREHFEAADWQIVLQGEAAPVGHPWRSVMFASSDGTPVQPWLGLPEGVSPYPMIIELHGGPEFAVPDVFSPPSQCWLDHGFAYLTVNYRGSAGFGSAFQEKIRGDLGHWEIEDIVAARNWVAEQGIAAPTSIFLTGYSYGGYLTLMVLGKRPDLWAGGMAASALADLAMNDADGSAISDYFRSLMGGSPKELPARYAASSPILYVDRLAAPVLILQGRSDESCTPRQVESYEARARALGKHVEVRWFESGHGAIATEQRIQQQEMMLRFVYDRL